MVMRPSSSYKLSIQLGPPHFLTHDGSRSNNRTAQPTFHYRELRPNSWLPSPRPLASALQRRRSPKAPLTSSPSRPPPKPSAARLPDPSESSPPARRVSASPPSC